MSIACFLLCSINITSISQLYAVVTAAVIVHRNMNHSQFHILYRELRKLLAVGLNDSVEILAELYLSSSSSTSGAVIPHASNKGSKDNQLLSVIESFEIIGDALRAKREVKRALNYYRLASQQRKFLKTTTSCTINNGSSNHADSSQNQLATGHDNTKNEISLVLKECQCLMDMKDNSSALSLLETITPRQRDLSYYVMSGDCYLESNLKEKAKSAFKEALTFAPFAIEIVKKLVSLGVDDVTIINIVQQACKDDDDLQFLLECPGLEKWYQLLISTIFYVKTYQVQKSVQSIQKLLGIFPKNVFVLTMAVHVYAESDMMEQSLAYFHQLRRTDATVVDDMDKIALMLFQSKEDVELSRLANDVINSQPNRPEGYNIAALYCALKEEYSHALAFVEKACVLKPKHPENYITRGRILLQQATNFDSALISFTQANSISSDLLSFTGLIEANVALGKLKDAARATREMAELYPKSAEACYLLGTVLSKAKGNDGINASINAYTKALKINPRHKNSAIALCNTYLANDRANDAIECLTRISVHITDNKLRLLMAKAYGAIGQHNLAMEQLQLCTNINAKKTDPEVLQEIEQIESAMRAENGPEEEEYAEDYADQEQYSGEYEQEHDQDQYGYGEEHPDEEEDDEYQPRGRRVFSDDES